MLFLVVPSPSSASKLAAMILVRVVVGSDDDAVAELASGQRLLRLLAVHDGVELHKHLRGSGREDEGR